MARFSILFLCNPPTGRYLCTELSDCNGTHTGIVKKALLILPVLFLCVDAFAQGKPSVSPGKGRRPAAAVSDTPDTLDTGNPSIRVLLYKDGTFKFLRESMEEARRRVFEDHWDTWDVNPYPDDEPLPERIAIWVADELDNYYCPNQTKPSSRFGFRHGIRHQGTDLPFPSESVVRSAFDGFVRISDFVEGYGDLIVVRHLNGLETFYGNLSRRDVQPGDQVNAGDAIGTCGETGETRPVLHFETRYRGYAFNPESLIDFEAGVLRHRVFRLEHSAFTPAMMYVQDEGDEESIHNSDEKDKLISEGKARRQAEARRAAEAATKKYYVVKSGDTLAKVARKNQTTVKSLCRLNGIKETTVLNVGQKLRVK